MLNDVRFRASFQPHPHRHRGKAATGLPLSQAPPERIHRYQGSDPNPEHRAGRPGPRAAERPGLQGYTDSIPNKPNLIPSVIDPGLYLRRRSRSKNKPALCPKSREANTQYQHP